MKISDRINAEMTEVLYELKSLPSFHELDEQYNSCEDPVERERLWRKRSVRKTLGDGDTVRVPLWIWWVGDTALIGQPNEAYSELQLRLRRSWPNNPVVVINLVNGSAGYLPPSELYASECYTVWQTPFAEGSLEKLQSVAYNALKQVQVFSPKL